MATELIGFSLDINEDRQKIDFLMSLSRNGFRQTRRLFGTTFDELYSEICSIIQSNPNSISIRTQNRTPRFLNNVLPIASTCNLNCPYCFAQVDGDFHFNAYTQKDIINTISFIVSQNKKKGPISIVFFGGEPLLKFPLIDFCVHHIDEVYPNLSFSYSITTNGTLITDDVIKLFKQYNFGVLISLDGPDNEYNLRRYKNGEKSIERVLKSISLLRKAGIKVQLRATILNTNPYILSTFEFFENLGVPFSLVFAYSSENVNHHFAEYNDEINESIESQFRDVYSYYVKKLAKGETIYNRIFYEYGNLLRQRIKKDFSCSAGSNFFTIMSNGDIFSCSHFMNNPAYTIGNIYSYPILNEEKRKQLSPVKLNKHRSCSKCWARYLCLGGCTSQIILSGGNNMSPYSEAECQLKRIEFSFYIKLFYHAFSNGYSFDRPSSSDINC